ncbi:MAG: hypothetical protein ACREK6_15435 [Candidatus Rokuibacteriota bacterium]
MLSPANCSGVRARMVLNERAEFDLACRLRAPGGAPLGEVFSFMSGLYFRGKLAYARAFAEPGAGLEGALGGGILVIVPGAGLWPADRPVTPSELRAFARVNVSGGNLRHCRPLLAAATALAARLGAEGDVVLLGSIASEKYVETLAPVFGERLLFPLDFVGRGDMSRGGLLLRRVAERRELEYAPVVGSVRRGVRPPKLVPLPPAGASPPFRDRPVRPVRPTPNPP